MSRQVITEADLHAYLDGVLPAARIAEVEAYLAERPEEAARIAAYREQVAALRREFDPVLDELPPQRLRVPRRYWMRPLMRYAAVVASFTLGGVIGWQLHAYTADQLAEAISWPRRAAIAHVVYSPEVRHPVEVGADQEAHLSAWLSKRLGGALRPPSLTPVGYNLVGGRLLPAESGAAAQFMYENGSGKRLTLYVRRAEGDDDTTAFRYDLSGQLGVFYWIDGPFGYALSGELPREQLLQAAQLTYQGLNP